MALLRVDAKKNERRSYRSCECKNNSLNWWNASGVCRVLYQRKGYQRYNDGHEQKRRFKRQVESFYNVQRHPPEDCGCCNCDTSPDESKH